MRSRVRDRLPACVVKIRSVLRLMAYHPTRHVSTWNGDELGTVGPGDEVEIARRGFPRDRLGERGKSPGTLPRGDARNPARHGGTVGSILRAELPLERGLFVGRD